MQLQGQLITGEFDEGSNEFSLQTLKHFSLETTINEIQFHKLYDYLKKHEEDPDGQIITLYDQLPFRLTQKELHLLLSDLEQVQALYH